MKVCMVEEAVYYFLEKDALTVARLGPSLAFTRQRMPARFSGRGRQILVSRIRFISKAFLSIHALLPRLQNKSRKIPTK